jgi:hypothetical protein
MGAPAGRIATNLDWGVLTSGLDSVEAWRDAVADGSVLRLFSSLFVHADWIHLLGIESPGLTSAPAIAEEVANSINSH